MNLQGAVVVLILAATAAAAAATDAEESKSVPPPRVPNGFSHRSMRMTHGPAHKLKRKKAEHQTRNSLRTLSSSASPSSSSPTAEPTGENTVTGDHTVTSEPTSQGTEPTVTFKEASGGIHPYHLCNEHHGYPVYAHFCSYGAVQNLTNIWNHGNDCIWNEDGSNFNAEKGGVWAPCPLRNPGCYGLNLTDKGLESCLDTCKDTVELGGLCNSTVVCAPGLFCNFEFDGEEGGGGGLCVTCPLGGPNNCTSGEIGSEQGIESCLLCELQCQENAWGEMSVDGQNVMANALSSHDFEAPLGSTSGSLVDCSNLVLDGVETCPDAEGSICLVEDYTKATAEHELARWCEQSGGVALVYFVDYSEEWGASLDLPWDSFLASRVNIPVLMIPYNDGVILRKEKIGARANISVVDADADSGFHMCWHIECSATTPCTGQSDYCGFVDEEGEGGAWCEPCPKDPSVCFFTWAGETPLQNNVESCASSCAAEMQFGNNCKLCGESLTPDFQFGVEDPSDRCIFCPEQDLKYPIRAVPLFSSEQRDIKCWQVQSFFENIDVPKDSKNCKLAQAQNYICGCEGSGYAGASTEAKRKALVWGPRVTAILSLLGSTYVLYDASRAKERRSKVFFQLMIQLSVFDIVGSIAYMLTSLPIPSDLYYFGAHGNDAACVAQGFFIQAGTISCYTNVSLAIYYYLVIKKGACENAVQKLRLWLFLCPIVVGLCFAFAGIPFYSNMVLWCNNSASWWPDIPVAIAIALATVVMGVVCWDVYQKENASKKWRGSEAGNPLSKQVFRQSFWFLMAFFATWPPYLALQFSWASGSAFSHYGLILFAGLLVPMQGFWNFFVYARTRVLKRVYQSGLAALSSLHKEVTSKMSSFAKGNTEQEISQQVSETAN